MSKESIKLETKDYRGKRTIFTLKKWKEKISSHPELRDQIFLDHVRYTLEEPFQVWPSYQDKRKRCYYGKYKNNTYVKLVIWTVPRKKEPCRIITAYQVDYIKEQKYPELKRMI